MKQAVFTFHFSVFLSPSFLFGSNIKGSTCCSPFFPRFRHRGVEASLVPLGPKEERIRKGAIQIERKETARGSYSRKQQRLKWVKRTGVQYPGQGVRILERGKWPKVSPSDQSFTACLFQVSFFRYLVRALYCR